MKKITKGCEVVMKAESGCIGYGNVQCISEIIKELEEITLYGHNEVYKISDIEKVISYPLTLTRKEK